jgi:hypothetical protein
VAKDIKVNTGDKPSEPIPRFTQTDKDAAAATAGYASIDDVPIQPEPAAAGPVEELKEVAAEQAYPNTSLDERKPIPRNMLDGFTTKMEIAFRDPESFFLNWHPHWFNEDGPRLSMAQSSGFIFVDRDEIVGDLYEASDSNNDPGLRVRKYVGSNVRGHPMYAYLMKKPMHIHQAHQAEYAARVQLIADALGAGDANRQSGDGRYTAESAPTQSALPKIRYDVQTLRPSTR